MLDNQNNPEESNENRQLTPEELAYLEQLYYKDMGFFEKHSAKLKNGWAIRKAIMEREKAYFGSEESDPERIAAKKQRDKEFLRQLKTVAVIVIGFLIFYFILRTIVFW